MIQDGIAALADWWAGVQASYPQATDRPSLILAAVVLGLAVLCWHLARGRAAARGQLRDAAEETRTNLRRIAEMEAATATLTHDVTALRTAHQASLLDNAAMTTRLEAQDTALDRALADLDAERTRLTQEREARENAFLAIARLERDLTAARREAEAKVELLQSVRKDMEDRFRALADDSMQRNGKALSLANRERMEALLNPLKEHVGRFELELRQSHEGALKERQALRTEIEALTRRSEEVGREALALTRALKGDKQRQGAWGEMILASILERSGLQAGAEYQVQIGRTDEDGARYRPDVIVRMPGDKRLVIDSKVSLVDYSAAVNEDDEGLALLARRRHVGALRNHIVGLSKKGYERLDEGSVDFVVMFIPIEGALSEALREDGGLAEFALDQRVTIATPTTLMMALRTVSHVWSVEKRNRNALEIADRAGKLYDKVAGFVEALEGVGKSLTTARRSYDDALQRLSRGNGNVLWQVETLRTLGARASKEIGADFDREAVAPLLAGIEE